MNKQEFFIRVLGTDKWVVADKIGPYLKKLGYSRVSAERLLELEELWLECSRLPSEAETISIPLPEGEDA